MKLTAQIDNQDFQISIEKKDSKVFANIDGRNYELEASQPEENIYLFKYNNRIFEVFISPDKNQNKSRQVKVGDNDFEINIIDPKRLRGTKSISDVADGIAEIKTAMPGKVVRILKEVGSEIKQGDGIIIVEAMKMQNEMKSTKDGVIKEIRFEEGQTVNAGDVLVIIE